MKPPRKRFYLGLSRETGIREVFRSTDKPNHLTFPRYSAVVGPFRTLRGAEFMRDHGNPHVQSVADAERLAASAPTGESPEDDAPESVPTDESSEDDAPETAPTDESPEDDAPESATSQGVEP